MGATWMRRVRFGAAAAVAAARAALGVGPIRTDDAKLTASDPAEYDVFGRTIAVSGDTVVVGAMAKNEYESGGRRDAEPAPRSRARPGSGRQRERQAASSAARSIPRNAIATASSFDAPPQIAA